MSPTDHPLEITLEFSCRKDGFAWKRKTYLVKTASGELDSVSLSWSKFRSDLESLRSAMPGSAVVERLGRRLRKLIRPTGWAQDEAVITDAIRVGRPVHLTVRADNADEIFNLPWEMLQLRGGGSIGTLSGCLVQYECGSSVPRDPLPHPTGRILFAYSKAGGSWVPYEAHLEVIQEACQLSGLHFDPTEDVLYGVTRKTLSEKLTAETDRPITVLHLLCHGSRLDDSEGSAYGLALDPVDALETEPDVVDATRLRAMLFASPRNALRFVMLFSCQGGDSGTPAHSVESVARMFHRQGVPAVIASRLPLSCPGSTVLAQALYQSLLVNKENLRTALSVARKRLLAEERSFDWISLQFYARAKDEAALFPFSEPPLRSKAAATMPDLMLIRHEAYSRAHGMPTAEDAPALFANRHVRPLITFDQASALSERRWENLAPEVARLASRDGVLRRAFDERDTDILYFGFPYVSFAVLAGYLAKTRPVHVIDYDRARGRFAWNQVVKDPAPLLKVECVSKKRGSAARVRLSLSAKVQSQACEAVLSASDVRLDLHFMLEDPSRGIVNRESQLMEYAHDIREAIDKHLAGNSEFKSVHVFAAVPVSIAFHLGRALAATGLPECFVYNYDAQDTPAYKWRLSLQAASTGRPAITVFPL
ncbi:SAVED domain-containing protein [Corallococcus sp. Z5C101001]|uniref:SAVED domain-containing protein n=1 Tax=Corallococcus sp. Z5C101001 TaxID=2596829 RepID=UPI00117DF92F|nr:SAVED domain-containing protein [Corallococcus sp. Z5C101001]TSC33931.1 SAVED domain-containing protein [Corallococcus sp. Z5C101001]